MVYPFSTFLLGFYLVFQFQFFYTNTLRPHFQALQ